MTLVVDASVGLKWILQEHDSDIAQALACGDEQLLLPDFWLHEATNVIWLQTHRRLLTPDEARQGLALLQAQVAPTPTSGPGLYDIALEIGMTADHSTYETMYVAFAIAMGARRVVAADGRFIAAMRAHPNPVVASLLMPISAWAAESSRA